MTALALLGGAVVGSTAGAAMHRWPAGGTLSEPRRSACSACGLVLGPRELVPVVSWIVQAGRCRGCAARIDARLPVLEASSALLAVVILSVHGPGGRAALLTVGAVAALLAAFIDLEHRIIPDRLTLPFAAIALTAAPFVAGPGRAAVLLGWALGVPLALRLLVAAADAAGRARPIGGGDVKLLIGVLALAGLVPSGPPAVLLVAVIGAGAVAVVGLVTHRITRTSRIAFAPAIAVGFLVVAAAPEGAAVIVSWFGGPA